VSPEEILKEYRKLLADLNGKDIARKSDLYYRSGWYYLNIARKFEDGSIYLNIARKFEDGSIGILGIPSCYRKRELLEMIAKRSLFKL